MYAPEMSSAELWMLQPSLPLQKNFTVQFLVILVHYAQF